MFTVSRFKQAFTNRRNIYEAFTFSSPLISSSFRLFFLWDVQFRESACCIVSVSLSLRYHTRIRDRNVQCAITLHRNSWLILELAVSRLCSISLQPTRSLLSSSILFPLMFFFSLFSVVKNNLISKLITLTFSTLPIHEKRRAANVSRTTNVQQWTCSKNRRRIRFARQVSSDTSMEPISTYLYIASEAC